MPSLRLTKTKAAQIRLLRRGAFFTFKCLELLFLLLRFQTIHCLKLLGFRMAGTLNYFKFRENVRLNPIFRGSFTSKLHVSDPRKYAPQFSSLKCNLAFHSLMRSLFVVKMAAWDCIRALQYKTNIVDNNRQSLGQNACTPKVM